MDETDADRVSRASVGDSAAARQLAMDHGPLVLGLCTHLAHDPEAAFRAIWRQVFAELTTWKRDAPLRQWIATHAHRHFIGTAGRAAVGAVVQFGERGPRGRSAERAPIDATTVARTLAMLPVERRRVVALRHFAQLPAARIAATEAAPVGAIDAHLHRGRAFIARRLVDDRPPWEDLSALIEGDLPPDARDALEARVADDPDLARAYKDMRAVAAALDDLERPAVPTALLDDVAAVPVRALLPRMSAWPWLVAVAATLFALPLALRAPHAAQATLDAGVHEVDGRVEITAGKSVVDLRGHARIEIDDAGAVAVHVYAGSAVVIGPDGRRITVPAGRTYGVSDATSAGP